MYEYTTDKHILLHDRYSHTHPTGIHITLHIPSDMHIIALAHTPILIIYIHCTSGG